MPAPEYPIAMAVDWVRVAQQWVEAARSWPSRACGGSPRALAQVDYRLLYTQRALNDLAEIIGPNS
jgi:hypothetical protein